MSENSETTVASIYRTGLMERVASQLDVAFLPAEVQAFLNSIATEDAARTLLVFDDEHNLFDPNGTWIPKTTTLVRQLLAANLVQMEDKKLICSATLVKLIWVRSILEAAKRQLEAVNKQIGNDQLVAKLLELSCHSSDFREGSLMMSLCIAPGSTRDLAAVD